MSRRTANAPSTTYAERLGTVTRLMDDLAESRLERVTRTARKLFEVESAAIVLWRGSRLVFEAWDGKALHGEGWLPMGQDAARVGEGPQRGAGPSGPLWGPLGAPRFGRTERHGFVAVAPLAVDRGLSGGALLLLDGSPRAFDADALQSLGDLATWAEHELDVVRLGQTLALRLA